MQQVLRVLFRKVVAKLELQGETKNAKQCKRQFAAIFSRCSALIRCIACSVAFLCRRETCVSRSLPRNVLPRVAKEAAVALASNFCILGGRPSVRLCIVCIVKVLLNGGQNQQQLGERGSSGLFTFGGSNCASRKRFGCAFCGFQLFFPRLVLFKCLEYPTGVEWIRKSHAVGLTPRRARGQMKTFPTTSTRNPSIWMSGTASRSGSKRAPVSFCFHVHDV